MWFEISVIPLFLVILLFIIFWIVKEGSSWQKHKYLGVFARFIQKSPRRGFFTFLILTLLMIPADLFMIVAYWYDAILLELTMNSAAPIVNGMLLLFLLLAAMTPVMWGSFRIWRQSVRAAAEVRVRPTSG